MSPAILNYLISADCLAGLGRSDPQGTWLNPSWPMQPERRLVRWIGMDKEKAALLEQADRCRRAANQIEWHRESAERLRTMAAHYESQAAQLEDQRKRLNAKRRLALGNTTDTSSSHPVASSN